MIQPTVVLVLSSLLLVLPAEAHACLCRKSPIPDPGLWALSFDAVFLGEKRSEQPAGRYRRSDFLVKESFGGDVGEHVSTLTPEGGSCSLPLQIGQSQVIFAKREADDLIANFCDQPWATGTPKSTAEELSRRLSEVKANNTFGSR